MLELNTWLDSIMAEGELAAGLPLALVEARNPLAQVSPVVFVETPMKPPRWTAAEEVFLRDNLGVLSLVEIAARLGRSPAAIKIRFTRRGFPAASRRPGWLTGRQVADILGVDIHNITTLFERNLMPLIRLPGERGILAMRRVTLYRWAANPSNWPYFIRSVRQPQRIADPHLRRLLQRQKARWHDEWWTIGQVAAYHGVDHRDVNRYIHHGKLSGLDWGNWWVRRSDATRPGLVFYKGKGGAMEAYAAGRWSPAADAFILRARAEGLIWAEIARRMKLPEGRVMYRGRTLLKRIENGQVRMSELPEGE